MPETKRVDVKTLALDLKNYRTVKQTSEPRAVAAMISTSADRFWALTRSLLADNFLPTENIIVLNDGGKLVVREGNRRIAALKLIHGHLKAKGLDVPDDIAEAIKNVSAEWKTSNADVPCAVYPAIERKTVDRIVALAHGKGQKAARDNWTPVARARHARDEDNSSEPGLDLLEKYLKDTKSLSPDQVVRWGGDYPLSVLDEVVKKLAPRLGYKSAAALVKAYPNLKHRKGLDSILHDIGLEKLGFKHVRASDFGNAEGIPTAPPKPGASGRASGTGTHGGASSGGSGGTSTGGSGGATGGDSTGGGAGTQSGAGKAPATAINDPKTVKTLLQGFRVFGPNRQKVKTLLEEAAKLNLERTPFAFCFVLRSMFEVSAKAYCTDHAPKGPKFQKPDGRDRTLLEVLRDVHKHITNNSQDQTKVRLLHPAMVELGKPDGLLSITSMNHLIHHPHFSTNPRDIAGVFGNVFPLLKEINA